MEVVQYHRLAHPKLDPSGIKAAQFRTARRKNFYDYSRIVSFDYQICVQSPVALDLRVEESFGRSWTARPNQGATFSLEEIRSVNLPVDRSQSDTSARNLSFRKIRSVDEWLEASYSTSLAEVSDW